MKKLFKKAVTVLGSFAMVGATMAGAMAATYPSPFGSDSAVVVGANAAASDAAAAMLIATNLGIKALSESTTTTVGGGDSVLVAAPGNDLTYGEALSSVKSRITSSDLPSVLADGKIKDVDGTVEYEQWLNLGSHNVTYGAFSDEEDYVINSENAEDLIPVLHIDQEDNYAWNLTLSFDRGLDLTDIRSGEVLKIAGKEFTIDPELTSSDAEIRLFAAAQVEMVGIGESKTVTIDGESYTIEVLGADTDASPATATVVINGARHSVEASENIYSGDQKFYVSRILTQTIPEPTVSVEFFVGADELTILAPSSPSWADVDLNGDSVQGLEAKVSFDSTTNIGDVKKIEFSFLPGQLDYSEDYYLEMGESIADPVFGTIKMLFDSASLELADADKEVVKMQRSGTDLEVTFTNRLGNEYIFKPLSDDKTNLVYHTNWYVPNGTALKRNDVMVVEEGASGSEISRVVQMTTRIGTSTEELTFKDLSTGSTTTRKSGDELWTTEAYVCDGLALNYTYWSGTAPANESLVLDGWYLANSADCLHEDFTDGTGSGGSNNNTIYAAVLSDALYSKNVLYTEYNSELTMNGISTVATLDLAEEDGETFRVTMTKDASDPSKGEFTLAVNTTEIEDAEGEMGYYLSEFGTYFEIDLDDDDKITFYVPAEEVTYNVYVTTGEVSNPTTSTGAKTVKDTETSAYANKNIIVVGGSAVNSVAAQLLGLSGDARYGEGFTARTGVGTDQFMIEAFDYATNKVALLVAGYEHGDTTNAVKYLLNTEDEISTEVGAKIIKDKASVATIV